jgi:uncharacterized protein YciI
MYYVVTHRFIKEQVAEREMIPHVEYLKQLYNNGKLVITGPFLDEQRGGMFILEVEDEQELKEIVENDPAVKSGISTSEVRPYKIVLKK